MSENINPYESTHTNLDEQKPFAAQGFFTASAIAHLKAAAPWIKFMGIMSFVSAGILVLCGILFWVLFPFFADELDFTVTFNAMFGIVYIIMGIVWIFPAKYLYGFAAKLKLFFASKDEREMEIALKNNASYWKFYGVWVIVSLAFIPMIFILSIIVAILGYAVV
jgi:hypothetical protein